MRTPYIFLTSLLSIVIMALSMHNSYAVPTTPPPNGYTGGLFSVYFKNMVEGTGATTPGSYITSTNGLCPTGRGIIGFHTGSNVFYGTPICGQVSSPQYWTSNDGGSTIYFTGAGNVGIGTSTPSEKLEVAGQVKITGGAPGAGKVLTSDATGLASWQKRLQYYTENYWDITLPVSPGLQAFAIGNAAEALDWNSMGLGSNAKAQGFGSTAVGFSISASDFASTGFGHNINIVSGAGQYATVFGEGITSNKGGTVIIGRGIDTRSGYWSSFTSGGVGIGTNAGGVTINGANGNVGIGTTTPSAKLEVSGDARINGVTVGRGLGTNGLGYTNTAVGGNALAVDQGNLNTAIGWNTLKSNISGGSNTAVGSYTLQSVTSGYGNTAVGSSTMSQNITGYRNTAVGGWSLQGITSGYQNTAIGDTAGNNITTGINNIAIGYNTAFSSPTGSNQLNIGNWIYGQNGVIGIGTATGLTLTDGASKGLIIESGKDNVSGLRLDSLSQSRAPTTITSTIFGTTGAGPAGIAIDSVGNVYTTNLNSNTVTKITPAGVSTTLGTTGAYPTKIAIDSAGNVYTTNANSNNVTKITPAGVSTTLGTTGAGPTGIAIDSAGNIYTANRNANNVTKITPAGVSTTLGTTGAYPTSIAIDSAGNIYTTNWSSSTITKITPAGVSTTFISGPGASGPSGIVMDSAGNLYVGISGDRISKINSTGGYIILGNTGAFPSTCAVDATGNVYTTNWNSNNVTKTTPTGVSTTFGPVSSPGGCAIDTAGNLYVTSINSNNVTKFTQSPPQSQRYLSIDGMGNVTTNNNLNSSIVFSGGNIGIGTSSPGAKLEVAGQVKITGGAPGAGKVLTSDATGLASWQTATSISGPANRFPVWDSGGSLFTGSILTQTYNQNTTTNYLNNNFKYGVGLTYGPDLYKYVMNGGYDGGWWGNMYIGGAGNWTGSGTMNVAIGPWAMYKQTGGAGNTAIGWGVLGGNTSSSPDPLSGGGNVAIGNQSMAWNSNGSYNVAVGAESMYTTKTGYQNTAVGFGAIRNNNSGYQNTGIGMYALGSISTGYQNTTIGSQAGSNITTGANNIAIGYNAQVPSATASNQLNIGNWIYGNNGRIGIGVQNPSYNFEVNGSSYFWQSVNFRSDVVLRWHNPNGSQVTNILSKKNGTATSIGNETELWTAGGGLEIKNPWGLVNTYFQMGTASDPGNVGIGTTTPSAKLDVNGNIAFAGGKGGLSYYNPSPYNQIEFGTPSGSNIDVSFHTNGISRMWIKPNGNVGIGVHVPSYLLHVAGTAGGTSWTNTSDMRLKKNIETLPTSSLETLSLVRPVSFDWKDSKDEYMKTRQYGFIAQEVEKVYPNLVTTANDEMKTKSVNYDGFIPLLVSSIQELKKENNALKQKNLELEKRIEAIEANLY